MKYLMILMVLFTTLSFAKELPSFREAEQAIRDGAPLADYQAFAPHPLYPYLEYQHIRKNMPKLSNDYIESFLLLYPQAPFTQWLAEQWFAQLHTQKDYRSIIRYARDNYASESVQCIVRNAYLQRGQIKTALHEINNLWLQGRSIDKHCDPIWDYLKKNNLLNNEMLLHRMVLAIENHRPQLVKHLRSYAQNDYRAYVDLWLDMLKKKEMRSDIEKIPDRSWRNAILGTVLPLKLQQDPERYLPVALKLLNEKQISEPFDNQVLALMSKHLARKDDSLCLKTYQQMDQSYRSSEISLDIIAYLLRQKRWGQLVSLLEHDLPDEQRQRAEAQYWRGFAYSQLGQKKQAHKAYQKAAAERDYFGFLAADILKQDYRLNDDVLPLDTHFKHDFSKKGEVVRALAWYEIGEEGRAQSEWNAAIADLDREQLKQAALYAHRVGWENQSILTASRARYWNNLSIRFPVQYQDLVQENSQRVGVHPAVIYAVIRQESAFRQQAKSPVGARGLMQIMPSTGKAVAKKHALPYANAAALYQPDYNIRIGSHYLHDRLNEYQRLSYAAASYNAGPSRVERWRQDRESLSDPEWIAQIPYYETRDYVKKVMEYFVVYQYILQQSPQKFSRIDLKPALLQP